MLKIVGKILQFFGFFGFAFCLILGVWILNYDIILGWFFMFSSFVSLGLGIGAWIVVVKEELPKNIAQLTSVAVLRCPNCRTLLKREQTKCEYCGAELILLPDGSAFRFRSEMTCPKCGAIIEKSSWFCMNCNTILTKDVEMLKELQRKIKFKQERVISSYMPPWMREKIESDEFIYFVLKGEGEEFYAITDKRIIKNRSGEYEEAPLSEVVSVSPIQVKTGFFISKYFFEVNTFHRTIIFDLPAIENNAQWSTTLHNWILTAIDNYNSRKKDVRASILRLPLSQVKT